MSSVIQLARQIEHSNCCATLMRPLILVMHKLMSQKTLRKIKS